MLRKFTEAVKLLSRTSLEGIVKTTVTKGVSLTEQVTFTSKQMFLVVSSMWLENFPNF